jgi:S1-C subfamily serine protease
MMSSDTHLFARLRRLIGFNNGMLLPSLLAFILGASSAIPGATVETAIDDRALFQRLEAATNALAEKGAQELKREARLEQAKRPTTAPLQLPSRLTAPLAGDEIYRQAARASVVIGSSYKCDKCAKWHNTLASGFMISADGIVATNHHVAAGLTGEAMMAMTADGQLHQVVEVLAADKAHDVALLRIDAKNTAFLPLRDDAAAGTPIRCYSNPANTYGCISEGVITRYFHMNETERNGAVFLQITADYARGSSGGPILDEYGNAVGMVASTSAVFTVPPVHSAATKDAKPATPTQQMVRHNCATARAILDLIRQR